MPKALAAHVGQALVCIEDPVVIKKILTHFQEKEAEDSADLQPSSRVPPADLFGWHTQSVHSFPMAAIDKGAPGGAGQRPGIVTNQGRERAIE